MISKKAKKKFAKNVPQKQEFKVQEQQPNMIMGSNNNIGKLNTVQPIQRKQSENIDISAVEVVSDPNRHNMEPKTQKIVKICVAKAMKNGSGSLMENICNNLRSQNYLCLIFNGGMAFHWNFQCEWAEFEFDDNQFRIFVWRK
mmetsp:Transcript_63030/g.77109  ORF Transcript_63030/g.77109 Transcript_63030/m.77109 type:complete len:143 (-) Transcript_63030:95-523(-)